MYGICTYHLIYLFLEVLLFLFRSLTVISVLLPDRTLRGDRDPCFFEEANFSLARKALGASVI